jgi:NDP-4-keto-2,6-dideoxyhexose 3-C-methyltransferase
MQPITRCRICQNTELEVVLDLGEQKLTGCFPRSRDADVLGGPLELVRCVPSDTHCGLLQLRHSFPLDAMYGDNYGYRSGLNQSMITHLNETVEMLINLAKPQAGDLIIDIGSNDGTLLRAYGPGFELLGIDPVAAKFRSFYPPHIKVVTEFFSRSLWEQKFAGRKARIISSIAMFYDIEAPQGFVATIADCLAPDGIWHFEQSYMPLMIENLAYDTVCHEHIEYYALRQIRWMLDRQGLKIVRLQPSDVNGGSLAVTAAHKSASYPEATDEIERLTRAEEAAGFEGMAPFHSFREKVFVHRDALRREIAKIHASGQRLVGYGASTKGNVVLQFCGFTVDDIPMIGEVNPDKFGGFTPGTCIPIVSEAEMHASKPDILFVLPWHFRENTIKREANFLKEGGRLLFPLPKLDYHSA